MFEFPLYIFILIYFAVVLISAIIFYVAYNHLRSTGTFKKGALFTTLALGVLFILVLIVTFAELSGADWFEPVSLWDNFWLNGSSFSIFPQ
jgi:hypothetical protein